MPRLDRLLDHYREKEGGVDAELEHEQVGKHHKEYCLQVINTAREYYHEVLSKECVKDLVLLIVLGDEGGFVAKCNPETQTVQSSCHCQVYHKPGETLPLCHGLVLLGITRVLYLRICTLKWPIRPRRRLRIRN
jgi:hypothetical protein